MHASAGIHGTWSHRWVFILAALGSSIGLGNIWKFPYITGEYGGGTFVLFYLLCILTIGLPLMMAEILIGRRARLSPVHAMQLVAQESGASPRWGWLGWLGMISGFLIFSFYSVVAAWIFDYVLAMAGGQFVGIGATQSASYFAQLLHDAPSMLYGHSLFVVLVMLVLAVGLRRGLDRAIRYLMPMLVLLIGVLLAYAASTGYMPHALRFLFRFDLGTLSAEAMLVAMGHAFFTLSLGMGAIMTYGAYLGRNESIGRAVLTIGLLDTLIALLIGLAVFPVVFASQLSAEAGPGLIFITLPVAFAQLQGGQVLGFLFFLMVGFTAWTSAVSLMEPSVAWAVERFRIGRPLAALLLGLAAWLLGVAVLHSFDLLSHWQVRQLNLFDLLNFVTSNLFLPLGGIAVSVFAGWVVSRELTAAELRLSSDWLYRCWLLAIRYLVPLAVALIFVINLYNVWL